jgi:hypothetical protein
VKGICGVGIWDLVLYEYGWDGIAHAQVESAFVSWMYVYTHHVL